MADLHELTDLTTPWCIRVAVTLRIPQLLADAPATAAELARRTECDPTALLAMLDHLVGKGVLERHGQDGFAVTELGRKLATDPGLDLTGIGGRMAHAWGTLLTYVRTGQSGYSEVFGLPFWEDLAAHPEVSASFDALMGPAGHGVPDPELPLSTGWENVRSVVDVGGGTGGLLAQLLLRHRHLTGTLIELPGALERAAGTFTGIADRVTLVGGSFFEPLPAGAEVYLLMKVLNDWPDRETVAILRRCAQAARPGGRILVRGGVVPDEQTAALTVEAVLLGGRTDRLSRFAEHAGAAGLRIAGSATDPTGRLVVELVPA